MNPRYPYIAADLHNHYPALTRVELARRNAQFAELAADVPSKFADIGCDLKTSFQLVEPRDEAKGNIARAIFYMHIEYDLPIVGQASMYKRWHRMDPPDGEENARNEKIGSLQGTRNIYSRTIDLSYRDPYFTVDGISLGGLQTAHRGNAQDGLPAD